MDTRQVGFGSVLLAASGGALWAMGVPGGRPLLAFAVLAVLGMVVRTVRRRREQPI